MLPTPPSMMPVPMSAVPPPLMVRRNNGLFHFLTIQGDGSKNFSHIGTPWKRVISWEQPPQKQDFRLIIALGNDGQHACEGDSFYSLLGNLRQGALALGKYSLQYFYPPEKHI